MSHLFAPWRHSWVTSSEASGEESSGTDGTACLFCRIWSTPDGDEANLVVHRGEHAFVMLNRFPYNAGHLLVVPVDHQPSLPTLSSEARAELIELASRALEALDTTHKPHGCNVGINQGRAAGAGIPDHVHLHIVPRWNGDTSFITSVGDTRVISEDLSSTWARLCAAFASGAATP